MACFRSFEVKDVNDEMQIEGAEEVEERVAAFGNNFHFVICSSSIKCLAKWLRLCGFQSHGLFITLWRRTLKLQAIHDFIFETEGA